MNIAEDLTAIGQEIDSLKEESPTTRAGAGGRIQARLMAVRKESLTTEQREQVIALQQRILAELLGMPDDAAERIARAS